MSIIGIFVTGIIGVTALRWVLTCPDCGGFGCELCTPDKDDRVGAS